MRREPRKGSFSDVVAACGLPLRLYAITNHAIFLAVVSAVILHIILVMQYRHYYNYNIEFQSAS